MLKTSWIDTFEFLISWTYFKGSRSEFQLIPGIKIPGTKKGDSLEKEKNSFYNRTEK